MIRSAVTISLVPEAKGGPFVFSDDLDDSCRAAAEMGFDGVELFLSDAKALEAARLRTLLSACRLELAAVGTGAGWVVQRLHLCDADAARRKQAREFVRAMIDFGADFGAPTIIGSMQGPAAAAADLSAAREWLQESLEDLGTHAEKRGVFLLLEPLNRYETKLVNTLGDGTAVLNSLTTKNVRLLADFFHMNIEECDMSAALRAASPLMGHVHFVDSNREAAGRGHLELVPLRDALREIGYDGYVSAEARPVPDSRTAARTTIDTFKKLFRRGN